MSQCFLACYCVPPVINIWHSSRPSGSKERGPEEVYKHVVNIKTIPEADVVESLVIDAVGLICVLHQLVDGEGGVVRLHHSVRDLYIGQILGDIMSQGYEHQSLM